MRVTLIFDLAGAGDFGGAAATVFFIVTAKEGLYSAALTSRGVDIGGAGAAAGQSAVDKIQKREER